MHVLPHELHAIHHAVAGGTAGSTREDIPTSTRLPEPASSAGAPRWPIATDADLPGTGACQSTDFM